MGTINDAATEVVMGLHESLSELTLLSLSLSSGKAQKCQDQRSGYLRMKLLDLWKKKKQEAKEVHVSPELIKRREKASTRLLELGINLLR